MTVFSDHGGMTFVTIIKRPISAGSRDLLLRLPMEQGMKTSYSTLDEVLIGRSQEEDRWST